MDTDAIEDTLCMVAHSGVHMAPLLAAWDNDHSRNATLHIANIVGRRLDQETAPELLVAWTPATSHRSRHAAGYSMAVPPKEAACLAEEADAAANLLSRAEGIVAAMIQQAAERQ